MKRLAIFGTGDPGDVAWSPDGKTLAVATARGFYLYDGVTYSQTSFVDLSDSVESLAFSPDGQTLAVAVSGKTSLWDVQSRTKLRELEGEAKYVATLVYGHGGYVAATLGLPDENDGHGSGKGAVLWESSTGKQIFLSEKHDYYTGDAVDISPDGKLFAFRSDSGIQLLDIKTRTIIGTNSYVPSGLVFSSDGSQVFMTTGFGGPDYVRWDIATNTIEPFLEEHEYLPYVSSNGSLATFYYDYRRLVLIDLTSGQVKTILDIPFIIDPGSVAIHSDNTKIAFTSRDSGEAIIWDIATNQPVKALDFDAADIYASGMGYVNGDLKYLLATSYRFYSNDIQIWDLKGETVIQTLSTDGYTSHLAFHPDQRTLLSLSILTSSAYRPATIYLWDIQSGEKLHQFEPVDWMEGGWRETPLVLSPDGLGLAYIRGGHISEFNFQSQENIPYDQTLKLFMEVFPPFFYLPNSHLAGFSSSDDGELQLLDLTSNESLQLTFPCSWNYYADDACEEEAVIEAMAVSSDGRYLVGGGLTGAIYIWDMTTQKLISTLVGHETDRADGWVGGIKMLQFCPHSNLLVSVGYDGVVKLWNAKYGTLLRQLNVCCYASFTPDGRYLVSAGEGVIRLWGIP